ncbi:hypothetical protein BAE44_0017501 [Dichanthelium oligosanthes]|uniref:CTLH domain-containing protein n=1 Tax=Dichanthelium oligosanthes TaxID=888268 RepID=A0A1E5V8N6_9POAL|nr:hypothetical protein BAE44_0017501 [Dichanthelium oligosanthes]
MDSPPPLPPLNSPPPVNWDALDGLVLDLARSDRLVVPPHAAPDAADAACPSPPSSPNSSTTTATSSSPSSSSSSSSSYRSRLLILHARRALEAGEVDAALALLRAHAPAALADHRLLFHLHKQRFVELVRRGTEADREAALDCLRTALAPCALDAYPEAYEEFKHVMLVLIYDKDDQFSPVVNEWSIKRRFELAGLLSSILRAHLQAYDPILSMTLRYLISIHKVYCTRQGISSPISDLTERLLFEDRDPPVVDVQALAHAVELTRQGAIDSLKFAKGDLYQAFQNELCRMKLDLTLLDKLVHEYCIYRGIVEGGSHGLPGTANLKCSQNNDVNNETQLECEMANNQNGDCSTSDITRDDSWSRRLRRVRSSTSGQRRRKRWRGRIDDLDYACEALLDANKHDSLSPALDMDKDTIVEQQDLVENSNTSGTTNMEDQKYEVVLEMQDLTRKGMASKVVEEISSIDPDFFQQNPMLLFQLKQVEFLKLVAGGDHVTALKVASTHLGPLAANNQALLKPLKETLVTLIKPNEDILNAVSLPVLASSLQVAMSRRLGIEEPQLMKIVRAAIHTHTEWFKLQMCKDRFEHFLKIDSLKEVDPSVGSCNVSKALTDECGNGSSQITTCSSGKVPDEGSSPQVSSEVACDENAILKVMEFLALPRADAIQLLMQYNGNAETVIQQIFQ